MSEFEYDPFEYAEALAEGEGFGRSDLDEARRSADDEGPSRPEPARPPRQGRSRRCSGRRPRRARRAGAAAKPAASGKFTGTLRVLTLGVEFPIPDIAKQASKDLGFTIKPILAPSEKQPQIAITSPDTFDVFGGYNYQSLQVWPSGGLQPVDTHRLASWNSVQAVHARQAQSGLGTVHLRAGERPVPHDVRRSERLDRAPCL